MKNMKKKIMAECLAIVMLCSFSSGTVFAAANNKEETSIKANSQNLIQEEAEKQEEKVDSDSTQNEEDNEVVLRVCNWEEYIDLGDWGEDEVIDLEDGQEIFGQNSMVEDFEDWYYQEYGVKVKVEYSCFGTNEDLYNQLNLGDVFDLVCPSDYMIMKLMAEGSLEPYSKEFFDSGVENNYYIKGVSPYIKDTFEKNQINGESWDKYSAGYMWGTTGIVYNPDKITDEEASTWNVLNDSKYKRQVTIKDNVRDSYFAAMGILKSDMLRSEEFVNAPNYNENLTKEMNDVSDKTIMQVQDLLQDMKDNVYSFESDSGKADMITGKVLANYQWSGDAVYTMDQAEEDDFILNYAVPKEGTNLWFDGWVMLKNGVEEDSRKQQAAEAFVNFLSRPDNVVRNMYYIGYTSVISGGEDTTVFDYINWCYGAEDGDEDKVEYPLGYFFNGDNEDPNYIVVATKEQTKRQLFAQYPTKEVIDRCAIMQYFDTDTNAKINQMWINIRCYNIKDVPKVLWITLLALVLLISGGMIYSRCKKIN